MHILSKLSKEKFKIDLLLIQNTGIYLHSIPDGIRVAHILEECDKIPSPDGLLELFKNYYDMHVKKRYDLEIAFLEGPPVKFLASNISSKTPKIAWLHIDLSVIHWTQPYFHTLQDELDAFLSFDEVIFVSDSVKKGFEKIFSTLPNKYDVINNPIPLNLIRGKSNTYKVECANIAFCIVGSLSRRKGHDRLLCAMERLFREGYIFDLYILGEGTRKKSLLDLSHEMNILEHVHFEGFKVNPYPYIKNCDCLISASLAEGYPLVVCEALAVGTPIIATQCSGNDDVLGEGRYGLVVENSEQGIYEGIKSVLDAPSILADLKSKSQAGCEQLRDHEIIKEIEIVFEELAQLGGSTR